MFDSRHPLAEACGGAELIGHLVQVAATLIEERLRYLPGQAQHRLIRAPGREQSGAGIQQPRAGYHGAYRRSAGGARIPEGHVAAALLMARADGAHLRLRAVQGIKQAVGLGARQAEYRVDSVRDERINQCLATGAVAAAVGTHAARIHSARITPYSAPTSRIATTGKDSMAPISRFSGARM